MDAQAICQAVERRLRPCFPSWEVRAQMIDYDLQLAVALFQHGTTKHAVRTRRPRDFDELLAASFRVEEELSRWVEGKGLAA